MTLSPEHAAFVREYLKDYNGTQAAIRAGYPKRRARKTAAEVLALAEVKAEIHRITTTIGNPVVERTINEWWVVSRLVENYERAIGVKRAVDLEGNPIGPAAVPNLAAANKALELIGRALGMFVNRKEGIEKFSPLAHLTDEELKRRNRKLVKELAPKLGFAVVDLLETPDQNPLPGTASPHTEMSIHQQ